MVKASVQHGPHMCSREVVKGSGNVHRLGTSEGRAVMLSGKPAR